MTAVAPPPTDDAAALRAALARLAHDYAQLAAVFDHSPDAVLRLTADGTVVLVNRAFEQLTGWTRAEAAGRSFADLLAPQDRRGRPLDPPPRLLAGEGEAAAARDLEGSITTRDGTRLPVSFALAALRDPAGALTGLVVTLRDRRRAESADALRRSFVAIVSHELQTPLAIIKGYASTLARTDTGWSAETLREGLAVIEEEADRLSRVVDDLLMASRIQAVGLTAQRIPVDLPSLVARLVHRFAAAHPSHRFTHVTAPEVPAVLADHAQVETVLRNLLDNAVKYAPPGSTITVRVAPTADGQAVATAVHNEGPPIPAAERERVFERFYRVDDSDARAQRGAGLGLYIARAIVQAHGGRIGVEPDGAPGTTVTFTLPVE
jgi:PAS domain S-box-containing protein